MSEQGESPTRLYRGGAPVAEASPAPLPIEKGIPIPEYQSPFERRSVISATARSMEVGDSVVVPYSRSPVAHNMHKVTGFTFTQRREGNNLRIWRVK